MARNLQSESLGRTRALPRGQLISSACCVSATALQQPRQGVPRTGRRVQSNFTILSCVVEIGQTKDVYDWMRAEGAFLMMKFSRHLQLCAFPSHMREFRRISRRNPDMFKRFSTILLCLLSLTICVSAQTKKSGMKKSPT